jgi:hypothetical protein
MFPRSCCKRKKRIRNIACSLTCNPAIRRSSQVGLFQKHESDMRYDRTWHRSLSGNSGNNSMGEACFFTVKRFGQGPESCRQMRKRAASHGYPRWSSAIAITHNSWSKSRFLSQLHAAFILRYVRMNARFATHALNAQYKCRDISAPRLTTSSTAFLAIA